MIRSCYLHAHIPSDKNMGSQIVGIIQIPVSLSFLYNFDWFIIHELCLSVQGASLSHWVIEFLGWIVVWTVVDTAVDWPLVWTVIKQARDGRRLLTKQCKRITGLLSSRFVVVSLSHSTWYFDMYNTTNGGESPWPDRMQNDVQFHWINCCPDRIPIGQTAL